MEIDSDSLYYDVRARAQGGELCCLRKKEPKVVREKEYIIINFRTILITTVK